MWLSIVMATNIPAIRTRLFDRVLTVHIGEEPLCG